MKRARCHQKNLAQTQHNRQIAPPTIATSESVMEPTAKRARAEPARRVIIDTDPGVDDALAILLAFGAENIIVDGLTIVCGNGKDIKKLGANAKFLARFCGYSDVPVCLGDAPLDETEAAQEVPVHVHGEDGVRPRGRRVQGVLRHRLCVATGIRHISLATVSMEPKEFALKA